MAAIKFQNTALLIFAAIGALASLVVIVSFVRPESAQLAVSIHPNRFAVPLYIEAVLSNRYKSNGAEAVDTLLNVACSDGKQTQISRNITCEQLKPIKFAMDGISDISSSTNSTLYEIDIENTGRSQAKGINLSVTNEAKVDIFNEENLHLTNEIDKSGSYKIPNLNPNSKIKIFVWTSSYPVYEYESYYDFQKLPRVTYENGSVVTNTWTHAPRMYADIFDFFNTFHWSIQILILFGFCFAGMLFVMLIIGAFQVVFTDKTWSQVFNSQTSSEQKSEAAVTGAAAPNQQVT